MGVLEEHAVTHEDVVEAATLAHAHDFITDGLELGYDTQVDTGLTEWGGGGRGLETSVWTRLAREIGLG